MSDDPAALDEALEQVIRAAREHLAAIRAADGALDDERVWHSYVALNNMSYAYDQLLLDEYGEVTPWDTEAIETGGVVQPLTHPGRPLGDGRADDPYPVVVSVRQRRDYRVPSVAALLATARQAAARMAMGDGATPPETVGEAVLELIRDADTSLAGLDGPELETAGGVVGVFELPTPVSASDGAGQLAELFRVEADARLVARLDERPETPAGGQPE
ncbi:hypothetical protein JQS43_13560 [Natronosporangium hydrolyticum]|uniref:Uncharacterized protein n=1 Tax=Natronosporangium hydrolyticum TaxID=2811111 RepID=A0A895YB79_9ACTN|nr:hypothetical protein [Natronosporangium hydrolyticum]QSB12723.1 hypothetical protein JQS43_13560 [Natronosporangium hydrolyticum]